jgi:hypothetical protein
MYGCGQEVHMNKKRTGGRVPEPAAGVPELEHAQNAVLNSLDSLQSRRSYKHAMKEFVKWYCSAARLAFNRTVVLQYRTSLEKKALAAATINVRLAAVRRLAAIDLEIVDGTRKPVVLGQKSLVRLLDGKQLQVISTFVSGPHIHLAALPYFAGPRDRYTVVVSSEGYRNAGFAPLMRIDNIHSGKRIQLTSRPPVVVLAPTIISAIESQRVPA